MEEQLISFETAKLAKEKGFDVPTRFGFHNPKDVRDCFAVERDSLNFNSHKNLYNLPTQTLLQKWLREVHGIHVWVEPNLLWRTYFHKGVVDRKATHKTNLSFDGESMKETYEQALEAGLLASLNYLKSKKIQ